MFSRLKKYTLHIFLVMVIFVYGINLYQSQKFDLWRDEAFSVNVARSSIDEIIFVSASDTAPPLHLLILHFWLKIFSNTELVARFLSTLFSLLAIVVFYKLLAVVFDSRLQRSIAFCLFAFHPLMLYYAIEVRNYSLLILMTTAVLLYAIKQVKEPNLKNSILFVVTSVVGLYTNVIFGLLLAVLFFWHISLLYKNYKQFYKQPIFKSVLISYTLIFLVFLPWLIEMFTILGKAQNQGFWLDFQPINSVLVSLLNYFVGYVEDSERWLPLFISTTILGLYFLLFNYKKIKNKYNLEYVFFAILVTVWFISFVYPLYYIRYLIFTLPLFILTIARKIDASNSKLLIIFIIMQLNIYFGHTMQRPGLKGNYTQAIEYMNTQGSAPLLHPHAATFHGFTYYGNEGKVYDPKRELYFYEGTSVLKNQDYFDEKLNSLNEVWIAKEWSDERIDIELLNLGFAKDTSRSFPSGLEVTKWSKQ